MSTTRKIMIGVGLTSGALLAAWLLTGSRKQKTKTFVANEARKLRKRLTTTENKVGVYEDSEVHYI
ncbi:MAG: hypothetical protein JNJ75_01385 [Cyclobacteriaceae bacterium]|nr:hypothetical protein [Cyclobacteriaceae bacterium]